MTIDSTWTLFLDRDGVINERIVDGYVRNWSEFEFLPGVTDAMKILAGIFQRIIVVSNQQGVGKGLMTDTAVHNIHEMMAEEIKKTGGRIDKIYYSPSLKSENSIMRKPNIGMALKARKELPGIHFKKCIMAGDSMSDMIFGKRLKMKTVMLSDDISLIRSGAGIIDYVYSDLLSFATTLSAINSPSPPSPPKSLVP